MKMMEILLEELTTKPVKFEEKNKGIYTFKVNNDKYSVRFDKYKNFEDANKWSVMFGMVTGENTMTVQSTGLDNARFVFSTVYAIIEDFMKKEKPDVLDFEASGVSKSRLSIYKRFVRDYRTKNPEYTGREVYDENSNKRERKLALVKKSWLDKRPELIVKGKNK
jgi:hypothetical protein